MAVQFRLNTSEQIFIYLIIKSCGHVDLMLDGSGPNDGHLNQELDQDQDLELDNNFSSVCQNHDEVH